jgi:hypothetical protein
MSMNVFGSRGVSLKRVQRPEESLLIAWIGICSLRAEEETPASINGCALFQKAGRYPFLYNAAKDRTIGAVTAGNTRVSDSQRTL